MTIAIVAIVALIVGYAAGLATLLVLEKLPVKEIDRKNFRT